MTQNVTGQNVTSQNTTNQSATSQKSEVASQKAISHKLKAENEKKLLESSCDDHETESHEDLRNGGERVKTGVIPAFRQFTSRLFGQRLSKGTAKNRLQMVLIQDRSGLSSQDMDLFRRDLMDVISRYFVLERTQLEIEWKRDSNATALIINTPVVVKPRQVKKVAAAAS